MGPQGSVVMQQIAQGGKLELYKHKNVKIIIMLGIGKFIGTAESEQIRLLLLLKQGVQAFIAPQWLPGSLKIIPWKCQLPCGRMVFCCTFGKFHLNNLVVP